MGEPLSDFAIVRARNQREKRTMSAAPTAPPDIAARLDRLPLTALHLLVMGVCALGFIFDLIEIALGSVLSAVFSTPPSVVPAQQLSLLLASVYVGAVVGAPTLGWLADRHGRRFVLIGVLLWLGLTSAAAATSVDMTALTVCRALSGLALGAYPPLMISYLTDLLPPLRRGTLIMLTGCVAGLGPPIGVFGVRALTPLQTPGFEAWRMGLAIGAIGAALIGLLFLRLPESPRWLKAKGRHADAERVCSAFERSRRVLKMASALPSAAPTEAPAVAPGRSPWPPVAALFLLSPWATVAFPLLVGAVLAHKGFALSDTLLYVGLGTFGPLVASPLAALGMDLFDRRRLLMACAAGMVACGALFAAASQPWLLVLANFLFGVVGSIYVTAMNLYGSELFTTAKRAGSLAGAWSLNRLGAVVGPPLLLPLLKSSGPTAMFAVIAASLAASIALLALSPRGRQRQSVA